MLLTLADWTKTKKTLAPKLPNTGMTPVLKKYEAALLALKKKNTQENIDKAEKALKAVKEMVKEVVDLCEEDPGKWGDLREELKLDAQFKLATQHLRKQEKMLTAISEGDAEYQLAWESFLDMKKTEVKEPGVALHGEMREKLKELELLAKEAFKQHKSKDQHDKLDQRIDECEKEGELLHDRAEKHRKNIDKCLKDRKGVVKDIKDLSSQIQDLVDQMANLTKALDAAVKNSDESGIRKNAAQIQEIGSIVNQLFKESETWVSDSSIVKTGSDLKGFNINKKEADYYKISAADNQVLELHQASLIGQRSAVYQMRMADEQLLKL